jgi:hypothetical protein
MAEAGELSASKTSNGNIHWQIIAGIPERNEMRGSINRGDLIDRKKSTRRETSDAGEDDTEFALQCQ